MLSQKRLLFLSLIIINFIYFISSAYITCSNDGSHFALVSALVEDRSVVIDKYILYTELVDFNLKDGKFFSDRPPGTAFLSMPFYYFGKILQNIGLKKYPGDNKTTANISIDGKSHIVTLVDVDRNHNKITEVFVIFLPNLAGTLAVLLMYKLFSFFKFEFKTSILSSCIFAFGTLTWFESTHLYSHVISMSLVLGAVYFIIGMEMIDASHGKELLIVSALLGLASIVEIQNILCVFVFIIYIIVSGKFDFKSLFDKKTVLLLLSSILIFTSIYSIFLFYNYSAFGEITIKSNKYNPAFLEEKSFYASLSGNFMAGLDRLFTNFSNKELYFNWSGGIRNETPGLFVLSPILLLSSLGFYGFFISNKKEASFFLLLIFVEVVVAALHKTALTRHIVTIIPYIFFPLVFFVQKSFQHIKMKNNYLLLLLILALSLLSIARVFYVMNFHVNRSLYNPFMFLKEIPSYVIFYGSLSFIYLFFAVLRKKLRLIRK